MLRHVVTDLHEVYLKEIDAQLGKTPTKPKLGASKEAKSDSGDAGGSPDDKMKKQARQLAYDTRYKSRREGIPLERAWSQVLQNSSAPAPVKELAKGMVFGGVKKEEYDLEESDKKEMVLVTPVKGFGKPYRRYATRTKIHQLRSNPQIQSVVGTSYGTPYEGERTKGKQTASALQHKKPEKKATKDYDGDGKIESGTDEWKGSRDKAIKKAISKKQNQMKEEFYSWRNDLREVLDVLDKEKNQKKISEKNVKNKIVINPPLKEAIESIGGHLVDVQEITEDYLIETSNLVADYFYNCGLNEVGLDIVIEELGLEKFNDFVFYVAEDYELTEARRSGRIEPVTKSGKSVATLKGGAKTSAIKRLRAQKAASRSGEGSNSNSSGMTAALKKQSEVAKKIIKDKGEKAVAKAKSSQGSKKPLKDRIAKGVFGAVKAYQQGMERHRAATATAGKALKVAGKAASEFGKGVASGVKSTATAAQKVKKAVVGEEKKMKGEDPCWKGYEMVGTKKKRGKEVPNCVPKEAVNPYAVGMAVAMKATGDKPPLKKSTITKAHKIAKKVKEEFETVDEAISTVTGQQGNRVASKQQDTEQKQTKNAQAKLNKILQARKNLQMAQQQAVKSGVTNIGASFEMEGDVIDERTAFAKRTGMSATRKGKLSVKGGVEDPAYRQVAKTMRRMEGTPKGQQKKVPGKKPPVAGQYGSGVKSPAQKVALRRDAAKRAMDAQSSRFD